MTTPDDSADSRHSSGPADDSVTLDPADPRGSADPLPLAQAPTLDSTLPPPYRGGGAHDQAPWMLGAYRILGKLGEGGMGIVYEAEQQHPRRRVALKVIRGGRFVDEQHLRMFQREIDTLARLEHPNIGAIYDAGRTEQGEHFFAMELVRGRTLDAYLGDRGGPLDADELRFRLRLFLSICEAVHYAHLRGVIHRDLKPSNIVVPEIEGSDSSSTQQSPAVKVLDFGLARITEADLEAATAMTEIGVIKGTLPYMSPEQARGNPDAIDVRADVYALGVILYEMLTGTRPYDTHKSSLVDALRIICEQAPRPLTQSWRGTRGPDVDLQTIVGKTLEKDAARRYASAAALAADLALYLDSRPILARAPSTMYQLSKFARRNRVLVAGIAATFLALVAGIAVSTTFGIREAAQRRTAEKAGQDLQTVVDFQRDMLDGIDAQKMGSRLGADLRVRLETSHRERGAAPAEIASELRGLDAAMADINTTDAALRIIDENILARAIETAKTRFGGQPLVRAEILRSIGVTYQQLGLYEPGEKPLVEARGIYEHELGPASLPTLESVQALAGLYLEQGRLEEAEPLMLAALAGFRRALPPDDDKVLQSMNDLAVLYGDSDRLAEADALYAQTLEIYRRKHGDDDPYTFNVMSNYGLTLMNEEKYREAEAMAAQALAGRRRLLGNENEETMDSVNNLAVVYKRMGQLDKAEPLYLEDYETSRRMLGDEHPSVLVTMTNLGRLYTAQKRFREAEALIGKALALSRKVHTPGYFGTGMTLHSYGDALLGLDRTAEAERALLEAHDILIRALGADSPAPAKVAESLARLYDRTGEKQKAERWRHSLPGN